MNTPKLDRRSFLRALSVSGAGTMLLSHPALASMRQEADPHYFVQLFFEGGMDPSYQFDARPLAMTAAGLIQNYHGLEPATWTDSAGRTTWATSLVEPLRQYRDYFSILNGVVSTAAFDGHEQNTNYLFSGDPFGGESFIPHLNTSATPTPIDALQSGAFAAALNNTSGIVPLSPDSASALAARLASYPTSSGDPAFDFIRTRLAVNAAGGGRFSTASRAMLAGFGEAPSLAGLIRQISALDPNSTPERRLLSLMLDFFRIGITRSAVIKFNLGRVVDTHAAADARKQPDLNRTAVERVALLFKTLSETPYDASRSFLDVTTVLVASEFGRTMRQDRYRIDETGTDHNPLCQTVLLGGKGVRGGCIVGGSDFRTADEQLSGAHLAMDAYRRSIVGRPFDFATLAPRGELPADYRPADYLNIASVVNTIYRLFGLPDSYHRTYGRNQPVAPPITGLIA